MRTAIVTLVGCVALTGIARADIELALSVKFILNNDPAQTRPTGNISTTSGFDAEIARGNNILKNTGRGFTLKVVEYVDLATPPAPVLTPFTLIGATTSGSGTITCNTAGLQTYMTIQGSGIPANALILRIKAGESFDMNQLATATNPTVTLTASYPSNYWFWLDPRENRPVFEAAAVATPASKTVWRWHENAINIYVNNGSSGSCSFVGGGLSIALGGQISAGTVLHELGHYFDLRHTHAGDPVCGTLMLPNPRNTSTLGPLLSDGDGLTETANDHACFDDPDLLSQGHYNKNYVDLNAGERAFVDSSLDNVMSYHDEDVLLDGQMDIWTKHANAARRFCTNGRTWFVANSGNNSSSGLEFTAAVQTLSNALGKVDDRDDVVLLRSGYYVRPPGTVLDTPCTLRATRGIVTIGQ